MSTTAISIQNLSKRYRVSTADEAATYQTLRDAITSKLRFPFGKRTPGSDCFWALSEVNLNIEAGTVVGLIGRNGAGKSTLLKILSRITSPTSGRVELRGRVGSLLEVGTGFHPELTGRENIFLNGSILGMRRSEILRQFDQIISFAGIERFLDTPVKRYSSGMRMRLAFSVAAHLQPEILLVDEVLAVGDTEFQARCLGKMRSVAQQGRTVVLVSHNMTAVRQLCSRVALLDEGRLAAVGDPEQLIQRYVGASFRGAASVADYAPDATKPVRIRRIEVTDRFGRHLEAPHELNSPIQVNISFDVQQTLLAPYMTCFFRSLDGDIVLFLDSNDSSLALPTMQGRHCVRISLPPGCLNAGAYTLHVGVRDRGTTFEHVDGDASILLHDLETGRGDSRPGYSALKLDWVPVKFEFSAAPISSLSGYSSTGPSAHP